MKGYKATQHLNDQGLEKMKAELTALSEACDEKLVFILCGNYDFWSRKGSRLENACEEHFKYCQRQQLDTAKAVEGIDVRHWTDPDLQNLPFYDGEHFDTGAAPHLLKLLHELLDEAPFKKPRDQSRTRKCTLSLE